jgi:hypothetical protein
MQHGGTRVLLQLSGWFNQPGFMGLPIGFSEPATPFHRPDVFAARKATQVTHIIHERLRGHVGLRRPADISDVDPALPV